MDRLRELQRGAATLDDVALDVRTTSGNPLHEKLNSGASSNVAFMSDFFGDVEVVKGNIMSIETASRKIMEINQNVTQATSSEREEDFSKELEPCVKMTNKKAASAKKILQSLRDSTEQIKGTSQSQTPEIRIRENLINTLTRKFVAVMKDYQAAQQKYKTDIKKKVKRQVQIVKPDATMEEIEAVFQQGGGSGSILQQSILSGEASDTVKNTLINVQDKFKDVLALEASVAELHQMFLDFALLVEAQGDLLDQIEHQTKEASDYIDAGNCEMVEAIEIQKSIRYKQACVCAIILCVLGIIVGIIAAKVSGAI